jgi:hypothetical protein
MSNDDHRMMTALFGPGVEEHTQDSLRLIVVPGVRLPPGCTPENAFAIYVASSAGGYESRLYFECPIRLKSGVEPKTTTLLILGRTMYAPSINGVPASLPPHQAILAHLARYEQAA